MATSTTTTNKKEIKDFWTTEERKNSKEKYGCEIIISNGSSKDVTTKNAPTDAYIVKYVQVLKTSAPRVNFMF